MATGPNYSRISVNDSGFYIVDSTDGTLSTGVSFDAGSVSGLRKITLPDKSGTLAMLDDTGGGGNPKASDITPGDASVLITTTAGGVSINTNSSNALKLNHNNNTQVSLTASTMTLLENESYTITHPANEDGDDLTIRQTGVNNSSLILSSTGTGADAIRLHASGSGGGIDIDAGTGGFALDTSGVISIDSTGTDDANITHTGGSGKDLTISVGSGSLVLTGGEAVNDAIDIRTTNAAGGISIRSGTLGTSIVSTGNIILNSSAIGTSAITLNTSGRGNVNISANSGASAVIIQSHTRHYGFNETHSSNLIYKEITIDDVVDTSLSSSHFVTARFTATSGGISAGGYILEGVFLYDKANLTLHGTSYGIGHGDADETGTGKVDEVTDLLADGTNIVLKYKNTAAINTNIRGLVTVTNAGL